MDYSSYPFTQAEMESASDEWGCNCGPSALAFALGVKPDRVRWSIPDFDSKRYTSPTMMRQALKNVEQAFSAIEAPRDPAELTRFLDHRIALVRIQWTGPWTAPGQNPKWAYRITHWIAAWLKNPGRFPYVFDCNGGMRDFASWEQLIVPALTSQIKRADGGYFPTHVWRLA